jgi:peptidoglycan/LPS O-acetylase OafA/YrhL
MDVYTPFGGLFTVCLVLVILRLPLFSATDQKWHVSSSRTETLDGLRGYLALGVFIHHAVIYYGLLKSGVWDNPPSVLYTQLGPVGVSLFFMITGFLFWGKVISTDGRVEWLKLFVGRVFRITPVYYLTMLLVMFIIFAKSNFKLVEELDTIFMQIFPLFLFGIFEPGKVINGYVGPRGITAAVTWTLRYEWIYYLVILPFSALFVRAGFHLIYSIFVLLLCLIGYEFFHASSNSLLLAAFFMGMVCASLQTKMNSNSLDNKFFSGVIVLFFYLVFFEPFGMTDVLRVVLSGFIFFSIVNGCSIYGLLKKKSSQRLGEISYSIYLLQGIFLYLYVQIPEVREWAILNVYFFWLFVTVVGVSLVFGAYLAYVLIEKPGIRMGKKFIENFVHKNAGIRG